jgi:predicted dehydrogenase
MSVRIGIIGCGWIGSKHAEYLQAVRNARLVAAADVDVARAEAMRAHAPDVAAFDDYRELLTRDDVDAVILATPAQGRPALIADALAAGKHVYCEKPIAVTLDEADEVVRLVEASDRTFMMGFTRRFSVANLEAKRLIEEGAIGEPIFFRSNFRFHKAASDDVGHGSWLHSRDTGGGLIVEASVHLWDLLRWLTGHEVAHLYCRARTKETAYGIVEDIVAITGTLDNGALFALDLSSSLPAGSSTDNRSEIVGSDGMVYVDEFRHYLMMNSEAAVETTPHRRETGQRFPDVLWHSPVAGALKRAQVSFVECVSSGRRPEPSAADGRQALALAWAACASADSGSRVRLDGGRA